MKKLFILFIAVVGFGISSYAQTNASVAAATSAATILTPITLSQTTGMNFGVAQTHATLTKTVVLDTNDGRATSTATLISGVGAAPKSGVFAVGGTPNATYTVTLPADGTITLTGNGGSPMAVDGFNTSPSGAGLVLSGAGVQTLKVGATLTINAAQNPGTYIGTYAISVDYN